MVTTLGLTRPISFSSLAKSMGLPASTVNSVTLAPMRSITSRMRRPKRPATMTRTPSPGSTRETALDSSAVLSELALLAPDEIEVAKVDEESRALTHDEDGVAAVNGVEQEHRPAPDGEEPEGDGDHAFLPAFGGDPLHEEPAEEEGLSEKAYRQPELFSGHDRRLVGSRQLGSGHAKFLPACGRHSPYRRRLGVATIFPLLIAISSALPSARLEWPREMLRRAGHRPEACHRRGRS